MRNKHEQLQSISCTSFAALLVCCALGDRLGGLFLKTTLFTSTVYSHLSVGERREMAIFQLKGFTLM